MSHGKENIRTGIPQSGRNAAEKRAAAWISQNSYSGGAPLGRIPRRQAGQAPRAVARKVTSGSLNMQRRALSAHYYDDEAFTALIPNINRRPRLKIVSDSIGEAAIRRFGFEEAKERLEKAIACARTIICFTADDISTYSNRKHTYIGLLPDYDTRQLLEEDAARARELLEWDGPIEPRALLVARFDSGDPDAKQAVKMFNHYLGSDPAAEHVLLATPIVRANPPAGTRR